MAKFLTGNELNFEEGKFFEKATSQIILIFPYIKLHQGYASILLTKMKIGKFKLSSYLKKMKTIYPRV